MSQTKAPTLFKCATCGKEYSNHSSFRKHMETHSDKLHKCDQCEKKYKGSGALYNHKQAAHGEAGQFKCGKCDKAYSSYWSFQSHMETHSGKLHKCNQCGKQFNSRGSLWSHKKTHSDTLHKCDQCEKEYQSSKTLLQHKRYAHGEAGLFKCGECDKAYSSYSSLHKHKETHSDKLHKCDQCEKKYKGSGALYNHKRSAHGEAGQFKCGKCDKEYQNYCSLQSHKETHNDEQHECDQCEKKYKLRTVLQRHKRNAHAEAGHFECDECGKACPNKEALRDHKRVHSQFECPVCGKKTSLVNSSRHMETHAEEPCECDVCGATLRHPRALVEHKQRAHSDAKHRCDQCGKIFSWASELRLHMTTHDEEREEYRCERCPRTFKTRKAHKKHMRIEHSDTRFTCDSECGLQSATRNEYLEHLTSHHSKEHPATCKCALVNVVVTQTVAAKLGSTSFIEAEATLKCIDGDCDFSTTCARQMESHKDQRHHDAYKPVLRCSTCGTWFTDPGSLKKHNAVKHEGERRFKCDCGYITNDTRTLTRHQTNCQQGKALGNRRLQRAEPSTEDLDVKKKSPRAVYQFGSKIGEGGFGKVYAAVKKGENPPVKYAIKEVGPNGGKSAETEAKRMQRFEHKNLMALLEYYEWKERGRLTRFVVMECCLPGSLTAMKKLVQFEEPHVLYVLREVTCGLEHLHSAGIIHRDLKSPNVLVNERAEVKIADFGVSTDERIAFNCQGTRGWTAPEVVAAALTGITGKKSPYTQKADMYSVGVMSVDGFLPQLPTDFFHKTKVESESFAETQLQRIEDDRHLQLSEAFKRLVIGCLAPMTTRLSAAAVQKVQAVKKASVEPFKLLVAECLKKQKEKEEKRMARKRKPTTDTEASSPSTSPAPRTATKSSAAPRLFSTPTDGPQQPSTSGGMSSLFSAKSAITHQGQPTANTEASSLFSADDDAPQQPSTSGGMSSLFATGSSRTDHGQLPASHQTLRPDEY